MEYSCRGMVEGVQQVGNAIWGLEGLVRDPDDFHVFIFQCSGDTLAFNFLLMSN